MEATIVPKVQKHYPVLLKEIISIISPQYGGTFIDCTLGQGGYTKKILEFKNTNVIAIDRDIESKNIANQIKEKFKDRFIFKNIKFSQLNNLKLKNEEVKGIIFDLGYSYTQIKDHKKGLSFESRGDLNMKMGINEFSADDVINKLDLRQFPFIAHGDGDNIYEAKSVVLATGAQANWLGLESEDKYKGFGVSACATCDGFFFRNEIIAVIGGGNTAVEEALFLTNFAKKVFLIHRRDTLRAEKILQKRLFKNPKVELIWNSVIKEIIGIDNPLSVEGIKIENLQNNKEIEISCKGVFIAIGHAPSNELIIDQLKTHNGGYVVTKPNSTETSIPGVFAAGDITDFKYKQAVTAAGMGCMAALEVEKFLSEKIN